jgi:hypothetical protein
MSLGAVVDAAARRRKTLVHYAPDAGDFGDGFAARNADVQHRPLPERGPPPFVVVRENGDWLGAFSAADIEAFFEPPHPDHDPAALSEPYRALADLLDDTVFGSLSRRQLLATSREIEDRAFRVGRGELHAGFQTLSAFDAQRDAYRRLATETDLDVHVYVAPEASAPGLRENSVTVHRDASPEVSRYWFVAFDGGGTDQQCALVAEQTGADSYEGAWTYDPDLVATVLDAVA